MHKLKILLISCCFIVFVGVFFIDSKPLDASDPFSKTLEPLETENKSQLQSDETVAVGPYENDRLKIYHEVSRKRNIEFLKQTGIYSFKPFSVQDFDPETELIILLPIIGKSRPNRNFIRETIGKMNMTLKYKVYFVIGQSFDTTNNDWKSLQAENSRFRDLILTQAEDSYMALIMKEISAFHWVWKSYQAHGKQSQLKWIIKMDDDILLNGFQLDKLLRKSIDKINKKHFICQPWVSKPFRDPRSKWYIPYFVYPQNKPYPKYCQGPMYIFTVPALATMLDLFELHFKDNFNWMEDMYLTGILGLEGGFSKQLPPNFLTKFTRMTMKIPPDFVGIHMTHVKFTDKVSFWKSLKSRKMFENILQ